VLVAEDKDNNTKGVDSQRDYMKVVKSVLAHVVKCDQLLRDAAIRAHTTLCKDYNTTINIF
jgi:hypothetical protein